RIPANPGRWPHPTLGHGHCLRLVSAALRAVPATARFQGHTMDRKETLRVSLGVLVVLAIVIVCATWNPSSIKASGFKNSSEMLAFVTGTAVAIERVIEVFWIVLGGTLGAYWPLSWLRQQTDILTQSLQTTVSEVQTKLTSALGDK